MLGGPAIPSLEFAWAHALSAFTKRHLTAWLHRVANRHRTVRVLVGAAGMPFVSGVVWTSTVLSLHINLWTEITRRLAP